MPFNKSLQSKLTLSHLAVTIICVVILELLILMGYWLYLRSDAAASQTGVDAAYIAYDITWLLADEGVGRLDRLTARQYILDESDVPLIDGARAENEASWLVTDENEAIPYRAEWLIIFDPEGRVLASNHEKRFVPDTIIGEEQLPGFDKVFFKLPISLDEEDPLWPPMYHTVAEEAHIGQSFILNEEGQILGWLYYRDPNIINPYTSQETAQALGFGLLGAAIIATLVSGISGSLLARSFSRRLAQLSASSAALAAGDLAQRVLVRGDDEIDQMGLQFNAMAEQIASQMQQLRDLAERNALLAEEARALAALEERQRLARDLHDAVKQQLFGLSLTAGSIRHLIKRDPDKASQRLTQLGEQAQETYLEMDRIIHQLRPAALEDKGLAAALPELVAKWEQQQGIPLQLEIKGQRELSLSTEQALYRLCQEALHNIARHANASLVSLTVKYELNHIALEISDNGVGFDSQKLLPPQAMGLRGMKERLSEIGGQLSIKSSPAQGTTISVSVPASMMG